MVVTWRFRFAKQQKIRLTNAYVCCKLCDQPNEWPSVKQTFQEGFRVSDHTAVLQDWPPSSGCFTGGGEKDVIERSSLETVGMTLNEAWELPD